MTLPTMAGVSCLVLLVFLLVPAPVRTLALVPEMVHKRWADAAFQLTTRINCSDSIVTSAARCQHLKLVTRERVTVYLAQPPTGAQVRSLLPDGELTAPPGAVDAVLVIDPFPEASWGHLVTVFNVEVNHSGPRCGTFGGTKLETGECISLALKSRCLNMLETQYHLENIAARCQLNFLPEVRLRDPSALPAGAPKNLLTCRPLPGYGPCPRLRPLAETEKLLCDPTGANHHRCDTTHFIETRCRLFETCDQAVLLSGGWNRLHSDQRSRINMLHMYRMLRHIGFHKHSIKLFFANGHDNTEGSDDGYPHTYIHPSAMKLGFRYHLRKMCAEPHCVDSLVLYLNSPATDDGSALLWDADGDGTASHQERYRVTELLSDLESCAARQVVLLVDQSFSGQVVRAFRGSANHANVQVVSAGAAGEYSWGAEFTRAWSQMNHSYTCTDEAHQKSKASVFRSHPQFSAGPQATPPLTLFGAPCDMTPPLTSSELELNYRGCQNLPVSVWLRGRSGHSDESTLHQLMEESAVRRRRSRLAAAWRR